VASQLTATATEANAKGRPKARIMLVSRRDSTLVRLLLSACPGRPGSVIFSAICSAHALKCSRVH
jgi:hypothetical protein